MASSERGQGMFKPKVSKTIEKKRKKQDIKLVDILAIEDLTKRATKQKKTGATHRIPSVSQFLIEAEASSRARNNGYPLRSQSKTDEKKANNFIKILLGSGRKQGEELLLDLGNVSAEEFNTSSKPKYILKQGSVNGESAWILQPLDMGKPIPKKKPTYQAKNSNERAKSDKGIQHVEKKTQTKSTKKGSTARTASTTKQNSTPPKRQTKTKKKEVQKNKNSSNTNPTKRSKHNNNSKAKEAVKKQTQKFKEEKAKEQEEEETSTGPNEQDLLMHPDELAAMQNYTNQAVPAKFNGVFDFDEKRQSLPFPASHVKTGVVAKGKDGKWWMARLVGNGNRWAPVTQKLPEFEYIATRTVSDKRGTNALIEVAMI